MNETISIPNEQAAEQAFSRQAPVFDEQFNDNAIIRYKRKRVRDHVLSMIGTGSRILELNAGTGEDAIYFAAKGHTVHATDLSTGMQLKLAEKVEKHGLKGMITQELRSFTDLRNLYDRGPYDLIFSNFAGLNCTDRLPEVLASFHPLLKPGGHVTLVLLPEFCLWEFLLMAKGKFKTAFRRFAGKKGAKAHIEGTYFRCWYHNPSTVIRALGARYELVALEGLCTLVPPSYLEHFAERHPRLYRYLMKKEERLKGRKFWRGRGDYYIITLQKKI